VQHGAAAVDATFPSASVEEAVRWLRRAVPKATDQFVAAAHAVAHHQSCMSSVEAWDQNAKAKLVAELKVARDAKKKARKRFKLATVALETVDSGSESDEVADTGALEDAVRVAKAAYARASRAELKIQAHLARVIRDHLPELVHALRKDPLYKLMEQLGNVPVYESLAHYHLGSLILGGTHEVQRATNAMPDLSSPAAVVLKRFALSDTKSRKTFERELRILARLRHPNVMQLTGVVCESAKAIAYIEMPYLTNGDLRAYLQARCSANRGAGETEQIFVDLLRALDYLHTNSVIHFDVKPDNILIDGGGNAVLTDFDVSKDATSRALAVGTTASTMAAVGGTLGYAAPEVVATGSVRSNGSGARPGAPADIWSAGCVLFYAAFHPKEITLEMGRDPTKHLPGRCGANLRQILSAMWSQAPGRRPTAAEALLAPYLESQSRRSLERRSAQVEELESLRAAPVHWNAPSLDAATPTRRIDVTAEMRDRARWLMAKTAVPESHGHGRDSHGCKFARFEPVKVWRIENHQLWMDYVHKRAAVGVSRPPPIGAGLQVATAGFRHQHGAATDAKSNEHYLFHGTKPDAVDALVNRGVEPAVGNLGGAFGGGAYFAENSSKSDQYVPPGDEQYMLLCRVVLGRPFVTPKLHRQLRRTPCVQGHFDGDGSKPCTHARYDSLLATTKKTDKSALLERFREFVVYERGQSYPEYLIQYTRERSPKPKKPAADLFGDDDDDIFR